MVAWASFGAWALKPGDAQAQSANETRGMPTAAEEMPGSWGNIRVVDDPSPESSKDIDGTAQWNEIALSKDDDDAPDADVSQMQTKNRKEVDEELRKARDWNDIPTSTPRAAAVAPAPSKGLEFSTPGTTQTDEQYNAQGDPHKQSRTWLSRSPSQQISHDAQLRPLSGGGIFVPTMTGGHSEPKYQIYDANGKNVDEARTGTTTYVPAGKYTVHVGTPVSHDNLEFQVNVVEGDITVIPVEWSGLIVKVVNDRGTTVRGNYEIVSLPDRSYIGLGTGALLNEGEMLSTWLLWPGKYMIISAGEGYQARKNFITVSLDPGELSRLTLVVDEETGDILGGGEIDTVDDELLERWWWASILIGGSIRFNHTKDVIGKAPGQLLDVSGFLESYFRWHSNTIIYICDSMPKSAERYDLKRIAHLLQVSTISTLNCSIRSALSIGLVHTYDLHLNRIWPPPISKRARRIRSMYSTKMAMSRRRRSRCSMSNCRRRFRRYRSIPGPAVASMSRQVRG